MPAFTRLACGVGEHFLGRNIQRALQLMLLSEPVEAPPSRVMAVAWRASIVRSQAGPGILRAWVVQRVEALSVQPFGAVAQRVALCFAHAATGPSLSTRGAAKSRLLSSFARACDVLFAAGETRFAQAVLG